MALIDSIISYHKCYDNAASTVVIDEEATNNGTATSNTSTWNDADGIIDESFLLDGTTDKFTYSASEVNGLDDYSFSLWVKMTDYTDHDYNSLISSSTSTSPTHISSIRDDGAVDAWCGGDYVKTAASLISNGTWQHIVLTLNSSSTTLKLFIDGVLRAIETAASSQLANIVAQQVGQDRAIGGRFFNGRICEIGTWGKALTDGSTTTIGNTATGEIAELYNSGDGLAYPFVADITINPSTLTLSTTNPNPVILLNGSWGTPQELVLSLKAPTIIGPVPVITPTGTITVGTGGIGSKFIATRYPVEEGLIAGTTKQTTKPNLEATEKGTW